MRLIVAFSSQLTTSSLYKLAVHRAIFLPYVTSSEYRRLARDVTATCNHAHLGTRSIASVTSPVETFLCNQHYQQVYRLLNAKSEGCRTCGVKRRHVHSAIQYLPLTLLLVLIQNGLSPFSRTTLNLVTPFGKVIRYATLATSLSTRFSTQMCACCPVTVE